MALTNQRRRTYITHMTIKGHTVHLATATGATMCGTAPRMFMGQRGVSTNLRCVTCPKCEKLHRAQLVALPPIQTNTPPERA